MQEPKLKKNTFQPAVSVIIAAKNEAENLKLNLPHILNQQYPNFEVIVVNDYSTDTTQFVLQDFQKQHKHLKIIEANLFEDIPGKKLALTEAIKQAQHDILLFTDADCMPASKHWIAAMMQCFTEKKSIVLGYAPYRNVSGFLNGLIRYETTITALNYLSFAVRGKTYMGVGRNLAYRKHLFDEAKGFSSHLNIISGDDDLFISQAATSTNVGICLSENAWCFSDAKNNWLSYIKQKQRHVTTSASYQFSIQFLLGLYVFAHFFMYILILCLVFCKLFLPVLVFTILVKTFCRYYLYHYLFNRLGVKDLFAYIPIFDLALLGYYAFSFPGMILKKDKTWQ